MNVAIPSFLASTLLFWAGSVILASQDAPATGKVCAIVDGDPIHEREIDRELDRVVGGRNVEAATLESLRRETLARLIDRRLVLKYLDRNSLGASSQEIDRQLRRIRASLENRDVTLEQYLTRAGLTLDELKRTTAWEIGWQRFLEEYLTDANLETYFQQHRRDFDGAKMAVAHILFKVQPADDANALEQAHARAVDLRKLIQAGEISFADAAKQHSAATSAADGGRIGRIGRRQPMPEAFSRAAFALAKGAVSSPVVSRFGVHLIQCQDIEAGKAQWQDVRDELEPAVIRHLFQWAADQQRSHSVIEIVEER